MSNEATKQRSNEATNPFGITREEILDLAAQKLADAYTDEGTLHDKVTKMVNQQVTAAVTTGLGNKIDAFLVVEMEKLLSQEVLPLTIWGDSAGKPTTIKAALHERAKEFWTQKTDSNGRASDGYGTEPRYERMFKSIASEEFRNAVEQNATNIVGAFKDALVKDLHVKLDEHIANIIRVKTK